LILNTVLHVQHYIHDVLVLYRWKKDATGNIEMLGGKRRFEFVCTKRSDNKMWSIPGVS